MFSTQAYRETNREWQIKTGRETENKKFRENDERQRYRERGTEIQREIDL